MTTPLVLLNPVSATFAGQLHKVLPGEVLTDSTEQTLVAAAGGVLVSVSPAATAGAAFARKLQAKGQDANAQALAMLAALLQQRTPVTLTDTLTGPGAASSQVVVAVPVGQTAAVSISAVARVTKAGTLGAEIAGDVFSFGARATVKNVAGTVVLVTHTQGVPEIDADVSMSDATVTPGGSAGNAVIGYANGALIGTGAVVSWTLDVQVRLF